MGDECGTGSHFEDGPEPRLLEVAVAGQRIGETMLSHDGERNAIGQRPVFVGPSREEVIAGLIYGGVIGNNFEKTIGSNSADQL